jgi:hypothetical protein
MKIFVMVLVLIFSSQSYAKFTCGELFTNGQKVSLGKVRQDSFYYLLLDILRDVEEKPYSEVWPSYSNRYESLNHKLDHPLDYDNAFDRQIRAVLMNFKAVYESLDSSTTHLSLATSFGNEIIRRIGKVGGPLIFKNKKFDVDDSVKIVFLKNKKLTEEKGQVAGIRWQLQVGKPAKSLILKIGSHHYIDIPLSDLRIVQTASNNNIE